MSKRVRQAPRRLDGASERLFPERTPSDVDRRITAATREFQALLQRHRVVFQIERGENSSSGQKFERIVFGVAVPQPEPTKDPVTS
jgi:hypothetical protein